MRTPKFDPNSEFAYREKLCKNGCKFTEAWLPVQYPPNYKIRVAELYARYKYFPFNVKEIRNFPELGKCITFIRFTGICLGKYEELTSHAEREFYQKMIHEKAPKRRAL